MARLSKDRRIRPPSYEQSQQSLAAPVNFDPDGRLEERDVLDLHKTALASEGLSSPSFSQATLGASEDQIERGSPLFLDTNTSQHSPSLSPALSFAHAETRTPALYETGLHSLGRHQADLEVKYDGNFDKEVYFSSAEKPPQRDVKADHDAGTRRTCRICKFRGRGLFIMIAALFLVLLGVGLGVGLGIGLKDQQATSPKGMEDVYSIGGYLDSAYYSSTGVFNGSGLALASQSFVDQEQGTMVLYFQHHSGTIRWKQLRDSDWIGGSQSEIVASDAKNGTPISAVAYALNEISTWHIFYINTENQIRQKSNSNATNVWQDGPINKLNLTTLDSPLVGMQACWYGSFYGDTDYAGLKPTIISDGSNSTTYSEDVGMHMWYASDETTFQQYGWRDGQDSWEHQGNWTDKNGHAGVGCYTWGPGTVTYTIMVNLENTVEIWWKDTNTTMKSTEKHPINEWTNSSAAIPNVHPSTSLGYTTFLYAQAPDGLFHGYNLTWHAEETRIITEDTLTVQLNTEDEGVALLGSHMSASAINDMSGGESLIVFYQTEGDDITEFTRDLYGGAWSTLPITIPDT